MINKQQKQIIAVIAIILIVFLGWKVWQAVSDGGDGVVNLQTAPSDMTVTANNNTLRSGANHLKPGNYSVTAKRKDFTTKTRSVTVVKGQTQSLGLVLAASDAAGQQYLTSHPDVESAIETIGEAQAKADYDVRIKNNPVIADLPYTNQSAGYRVDYSPSTTATKATVYVVSTNSPARSAALAWMQSVGYKSSDITFNYVTDPTIGDFPYNSLDFTIDDDGYSHVSGSTYLPIFSAIYSVASAYANDPSMVTQFKQEIIDYLQSLGAAPGSYVINYQANT